VAQKCNYRQAVQELRRAASVVLTAHVKPDGDALGSMMALRRWLLAEGKHVEVIVPTAPPRKYAFLDPERSVKVAGREVDAASVERSDLVCLVDTGAWQQLEGVEALVRNAAFRLVIDHHQTQDDLADFMLVDSEAAATATLVYAILSEAGAVIDAEIATCLFAGLAADTDWFRLPTTDAETLRLAATLLEAGARPDRIHEEMFWNDDLAKIHLLGRAVETMRPALGGRVMVMRLTQDMFREVGADAGDTENLINECMKVRGVLVGLMLVETGNGYVRVSLRSRPGTDILGVATHFGGGGHQRAAGARLKGPLPEVENAVLAALKSLLDAPQSGLLS